MLPYNYYDPLLALIVKLTGGWVDGGPFGNNPFGPGSAAVFSVLGLEASRHMEGVSGNLAAEMQEHFIANIESYVNAQRKQSEKMTAAVKERVQ